MLCCTPQEEGINCKCALHRWQNMMCSHFNSPVYCNFPLYYAQCSLLLIVFPIPMLISKPPLHAELALFLNVWAVILSAIISKGLVFKTYFKWHNAVYYFQRFPCFNILQDDKYNHVHQILFRLFVIYTGLLVIFLGGLNLAKSYFSMLANGCAIFGGFAKFALLF